MSRRASSRVASNRAGSSQSASGRNGGNRASAPPEEDEDQPGASQVANTSRRSSRPSAAPRPSVVPSAPEASDDEKEEDEKEVEADEATETVEALKRLLNLGPDASASDVALALQRRGIVTFADAERTSTDQLVDRLNRTGINLAPAIGVGRLPPLQWLPELSRLAPAGLTRADGGLLLNPTRYAGEVSDSGEALEKWRADQLAARQEADRTNALHREQHAATVRRAEAKRAAYVQLRLRKLEHSEPMQRAPAEARAMEQAAHDAYERSVVRAKGVYNNKAAALETSAAHRVELGMAESAARGRLLARHKQKIQALRDKYNDAVGTAKAVRERDLLVARHHIDETLQKLIAQADREEVLSARAGAETEYARNVAALDASVRVAELAPVHVEAPVAIAAPEHDDRTQLKLDLWVLRSVGVTRKELERVDARAREAELQRLAAVEAASVEALRAAPTSCNIFGRGVVTHGKLWQIVEFLWPRVHHREQSDLEVADIQNQPHEVLCAWVNDRYREVYLPLLELIRRARSSASSPTDYELQWARESLLLEERPPDTDRDTLIADLERRAAELPRPRVPESEAEEDEVESLSMRGLLRRLSPMRFVVRAGRWARAKWAYGRDVAHEWLSENSGQGARLSYASVPYAHRGLLRYHAYSRTPIRVSIA